MKIFQNFFDPQNPCITICITVCITVVIFDKKSGNFKIFAGQISNFCITIVNTDISVCQMPDQAGYDGIDIADSVAEDAVNATVLPIGEISKVFDTSNNNFCIFASEFISHLREGNRRTQAIDAMRPLPFIWFSDPDILILDHSISFCTS